MFWRTSKIARIVDTVDLLLVCVMIPKIPCELLGAVQTDAAEYARPSSVRILVIRRLVRPDDPRTELPILDEK